MMLWTETLETPDTSGWIEIFILSALLYLLFRVFKGTRGSAILSGLIILFTILYAVTSLSNLDVLNWILSKLMLYITLAVVVIFQPEIRRVLAQIGRKPWGKSDMSAQESLVEPILEAVKLLSKRKIGALIAVEREISTRIIQDTGTAMESQVSSELLSTLFFPHTPLHDGGVIISGDRIQAAGCLFPLSQKEELSKMLGTRHRAAIGITEETDAVVIVVSEETGTISIAYNGKLRRGLESHRLQRVLSTMLRRERTGLTRFQEKINSGENSFLATGSGSPKKERHEK